MRWIGLAAVLAALSSCSSVADSEVAEREVHDFHRAFNEQKFASLYEAAGPGFRGERSKDEFVALMQAVHRRLGPVERSHLQGWRSNYGHRFVTFTTVTFETKFSNGTATETFTFLMSRQKPKLVKYNVISISFVPPIDPAA